MIVRFIISLDEELHPSMDGFKTTVLESYRDPDNENVGYDVIEVEVPSLTSVIKDDGYVVAEVDHFDENGKDVYFVTAWEEML